MEEVEYKFIPSLIKEEENVIPKTKLDSDFSKLLKKEICEDIDSMQNTDWGCSVAAKMKLEKGFPGDQEYEMHSNLILRAKSVSNNISEKLTEDHLACHQDTVSLTSHQETEKTSTRNMAHVRNIISSSNLEHSHTDVAVSKGVNAGKMIYNCDTCNTVFNEILHILVPKMNKKLNDETITMSYNCKNCYAALKAESQSFAIHKRLYAEDKRYKCHICSAAFARKGHYTRHIKRHAGDKPYMCGICAAAFASNYELTRHTRKHTGEKSYKCDICSAAFARRYYVTSHKRTHTGEKLYMCDVCSVGFRTKSALARHKQTHIGEKPYECDIGSVANAPDSEKA